MGLLETVGNYWLTNFSYIEETIGHYILGEYIGGYRLTRRLYRDDQAIQGNCIYIGNFRRL